MDARAGYELGWMFIDINAYFATVEQEERPELRGRPIGIVPVQAESTCCIAVSYEAKAYGIRTGLRVSAARALCPQLELVLARPRLYVEYHHRIKAAIERCVPVQQAMSCDEFACRLMGRECEVERAVEIAEAVKEEIRGVGRTIRCSIGIGPNRLLAKIAGEMQKPDGLTVLERRGLPQSLYGLELHRIPGIGRRMERRVHGAGVQTMEQLCALPRDAMKRIWGGVWGDRMWLWLRGEDFLEPAPPKVPQSLMRQHILPPNCRTYEQGRAVAIKLMHSTARKMRMQGLWASAIYLRVGYMGKRYAYDAHVNLVSCQDPYILQAHMIDLWNSSPSADRPADLTVALTGLTSEPPVELFETAPNARSKVVSSLDALNGRFGLNTVYFGSIHNVRKEAPTRVPFGPPPALSEFRDTADPED
ncbi:DNA polymerase Y family protein [Granulicella tundricola]|uniref:DNA-directed DNA polymerase n=1 Tax=Granulicella tundricola (strain ATCC BAA-1859 / DSM 23138 / MP5ACTX9) TaxID=1198114 RepID=E8WX05_GRATM|nr:DNA-directed DNA polymerase [Granulicella tundricola]ADW68566.1 DNA-directed DNA polymerase [Granulicella tundricola MP5ACTX9]